MQTIIAKDFHWEMAHRLPFHDGGCKNLHGHSYKARVELTGEPDANGMVMDYFDLKKLVMPIVERLDHAFICDTSDTVMVEFFQKNPLKVVYVDFPTTAENIAAYFIREIQKKLQEKIITITALNVRVHETERTFAEVKVTMPAFEHQDNKLS